MTAYPPGDPPGVLDPPLGLHGDDGRGPSPGDGNRLRRWRGLLAWSATSAPVGLLLVAGIAVGPRGINLLSLSTLSLLDPVVPVALAAFGVLIGVSANERRTSHARTLGAAGLAAVVTALVVSLRVGSLADAAALVAQASAVTLALAAAAWLLLTQAPSETEERVFAVSGLLLVGGVAAALSLSALFGGLIAGLLWRYAGRQPRATIRRDVLLVQHPLLVLVLLVAGARADLSSWTLALGLGYGALRVAGQLAAGAIARRVRAVNGPGDLGLHLLPPGVFGVALALDAGAVVGADASLLLAAVVVGTIASELVAVPLSHRSVRE
jgi:hypothetical protein